MIVEIESGIPAPVFKAPRGPSAKYPFRYMQVGESFVFPNPLKKTDTQLLSYAGNLCGQYAKRLGEGRRFVSAYHEQDGGRVVRVWRVA